MMITKLYKKAALLGAAGLFAAGLAAPVQAATYDFLAAANAGGGIGESIFAVYNTNANFVGPNLEFTASATDDNDQDQFVYFDDGNAGMGVCKDATAGAQIGVATHGSTNRCNPGSDDGITSVFETLTIKATETAVNIKSVWFNANHDRGASVTDTSYLINGVLYTSANMVSDNVSGTGNYRIDLGFNLGLGGIFSITPVSGLPNSYLSAIEVSAVPLPAAGVLMLGALGGLGGLSAMRRRKRAA